MMMHHNQLRAQVTTELTDLNNDYWFDVDHNWGREAHHFFAEDGEYVIQDLILSGRTAIRDFYAWREGRGSRVARHCIVNFRVSAIESDRAEADWTLLLYAADGKPILPSAAPIQICDGRDICVRSAEGRWRYVSRRLTTIFAGGAAATIPTAEEVGTR